MWGLFVGIVIGVLQVIGLYTFGKMIFGENSKAKLLGALLLLVKIALIILVLVLISTVSLTHVIWTAGGMLLGLIGTLAFKSMRHHNKDMKDRGNTGGKDSIDG
jgi:cobalamin biosynthesis protein CobD/CbiB